jgi:hypothetical protein
MCGCHGTGACLSFEPREGSGGGVHVKLHGVASGVPVRVKLGVREEDDEWRPSYHEFDYIHPQAGSGGNCCYLRVQHRRQDGEWAYVAQQWVDFLPAIASPRRSREAFMTILRKEMQVRTS